MSKNRIVFIVGIILVLIQHLGFPSKWKTFFLTISGLVLISLSLSNSVKRRMGMKFSKDHGDPSAHSFVDSQKSSKESVEGEDSQ